MALSQQLLLNMKWSEKQRYKIALKQLFFNLFEQIKMKQIFAISKIKLSILIQ